MAASSHDPLAQLRGPEDPEFDVFLEGTVFLDIIFASLRGDPHPGTEVFADGMASCPGGIANLAVATRRIGLRTSLAASFGDDDYGDFCWRTLEQQERVDLSRSRRFDDWHSPVTVSIAREQDRSMITHAHPSPLSADDLIGEPPRCRAVICDLATTEGPDGWAPPAWADLARQDGALVFADVGWDPQEKWCPEVLDQLPSCYAFTPNQVEAMAYTRTQTPYEALYALADRVPLAVVTRGSDGAIAIDASTGEEASVPALRVVSVDPTGAGDVFAAAFVTGTLARWALPERLAFANLCASLSVQQYGGSLAAPTWGDVADWWLALSSTGLEGSYRQSLLRRYAFLEDFVPLIPHTAPRRATATIARRSDVPEQ